ncbi:hypothetical protein GCM10023201_40700 [Actinomycetospora corticicola]|uniref:Ribbon-helix-helix protein CopG domain-containing protein n=1 Tax=Actinomycetospora corticicola TaxID=663602 RepID=A0A7Y9J6A2_9PSEU|nr:hypothetical protein [Actinomycetospora corticicola]NYD36846.1 hypothetical protein [Actinomycetospora corticicola]
MAGTAKEQQAAEKQVVAERMTVGLIPKVVSDLSELLTLTGFSKAEIINRAITLYAFISQELAQGNELLVRDRETGQLERIHLL